MTKLLSVGGGTTSELLGTPDELGGGSHQLLLLDELPGHQELLGHQTLPLLGGCTITSLDDGRTTSLLDDGGGAWEDDGSMTTWLLDGSGSVPEVELELLDGQVASLDEGGSIHDDDGQGTSLDDGGCTHDDGGSIHDDDGTTQDDEGSTSDDELIQKLELDQPEELLLLQFSQQQHPAWWLTAQEPSSRISPPFSIRSVTVRW